MERFCFARRRQLMLSSFSFFLIAVIAMRVLTPTPVEARNYELGAAEKARFQKYLPKTYAKLRSRKPVHVVALGDSVTNMLTLDEHRYDWVQSYPAMFMEKWAEQFFYTGGVRLVKTHSKARENKRLPIMGPELTLRTLAENGATAYQGFLRAESLAFQTNPDVVIVNFGLNDANFGAPLGTYRANIGKMIDLIRSKGAEPIILGCTVCALDPAIEHLGLTRPYVSAAREEAKKRSALFVDLGDLANFVSPLQDFEKPEELIAKVMRQLESGQFRFENGKIDYLHINRKAHQRLGSVMYKRLLDPIIADVSLAPDARAVSKAGDKVLIEAELKNSTDEVVTCQVAPLPLGRYYVCENPAFEVEIPAGGSVPLSLTYALDPTKSDLPLLPADEPMLRVPIIVSTKSRTTTVVAMAKRLPLGVSWTTGLSTNLSDETKIKAVVTNNSDEAFSGSFTVSWKDQKAAGTLTLASGEAKEIAIPVTFPTDPDVQRTKGAVTLAVDGGAAGELTFVREMEISRNLGLSDWVPLVNNNFYGISDALHISKPTNPGVLFRADADDQALFLSYDISGYNFLSSEINPSVLVGLSIDGRGFKSRQRAGSVQEIGISFASTEDGKGKVKKLQMGTFGDGYNQVLEASGITADLSTRPNGNRRITIAIPRKYFYLHEYGKVPDQAIGNGNSQFGINTTISLLETAGDPGGFYPAEKRFSLVRPRINRNDAQGLSALELASPATARWSLRLF